MILVSACLGGVDCYYKGGNRTIPELKTLVDSKRAIAICPEVLGGLPVPREETQIAGANGEDVLAGNAKVITRSGKDVTGNFIRGALRSREKALERKVDLAILKARSPSCGKGNIYDGTFSGRLRNGNGLFAELLIKEGLKVLTEEEYLKKEGEGIT